MNDLTLHYLYDPLCGWCYGASPLLAAEALDGLGAAMLARIQCAHYVEGRRIAERPILLELAAELGLGEGFAEAFDACSGEPLRAHFADSRRLMNRLGAAGFPTFALEHDGRLQVLDTGRYLGQPDDWRALLETQLRVAGGSGVVGGAAAPLCRIDGCA
ncbi:hypothetical protein [Pseudomonas aeruginosa]|uniref:hypothetical protein n=1 Tax=Pseudomonas aeruginosa TaxID=287 RepID=UPI00104875C3|nr:hypothetical protein [Pseudomonas aeruginosa]HCE6900324.1 hypothetical protein [Pseudomonas aeruginosa]HCE6907105.1 hypothetical protein [Pseudomonas aeruginosa]HCE7023911.1 hypothetical protein [Pseudomonas aeruginosa]HCE7067878.1 hypothetical protein [Pseudomonas aeruginosa]HCE7351553.1 hypothetical protein [Pseudomonas aeruginosa]